MSVGLVSTVVLALAAGLLTSVKSSQAAKETQEVDAALSAYAESFKAAAYPAPAPPDVCPTDGQLASMGLLATGNPEVTEVEHWNGTTWATDCLSFTSDPGVHRLSVKVTLDNGSTAVGQTVVRKP